jgi:AraC-like DNA-binding protein
MPYGPRGCKWRPGSAVPAMAGGTSVNPATRRKPRWDTVIFLETVEHKSERPRMIPAAARDIGLLVRLGNPSRAREVLHALILEVEREPHARPWVLDCSIEILALLISELRDAGNRSEALPGILRHFVMAGYRATSPGELLSLLEWSVEQLIGHSHDVSDQPADLAERVCEYVERHLAEPINLQRLCKDTLFVSPYHFSRIFHKAKGMSFTDWLLARRMERATHLLATTEQSIAAVASSCGYSDPRYFARVFRRALGVTPSQYREAPPASTSADATC